MGKKFTAFGDAHKKVRVGGRSSRICSRRQNPEKKIRTDLKKKDIYGQCAGRRRNERENPKGKVSTTRKKKNSYRENKKVKNHKGKIWDKQEIGEV